MNESIIYRNIHWYRFLMNILYLGFYKRRFNNITRLISRDSKSVVEFCFGDVFIAKYCRDNGIDWIGYDLNEEFVNYAVTHEFNAIIKDILLLEDFPQCDTYIMIGSLYHFKEYSLEILTKMIKSSKQVIISEPIKNIATAKGLLGDIARKSTNAGKGSEGFRYNLSTFTELMSKLNVNYKIVSIDKDILIEIKND